MSELTEAVDRLVSVYDGSPDTMGYMADRYPGLHHAIENVMVARTRTRDAEDIPVALVAQIQDGGKYLLGTARPVTAQQAEHMQALLRERFPHATFAIAGPDLRVQVEQRPESEAAVLLPDLLAAVWRAEAAASAENAKATNENARTALYGACRALRLLARALTPERDGAGAPSPAPSEPDVATDLPAPSRPTVLCGDMHPKLNLMCTLVQGHGTLEHCDAVHGVWWKAAPRCASRHHSNQGESACIGKQGHAGDHWDGLGVMWP